MRTLALLLALAAPAPAIELSLEENRAERGSVGFVDMNRLFAAAPDAQRAKENFEELVRQAEEEVNSRRAALLRLRQEVDALKAERETIARSTPTAPAPAPAPAKAAVRASTSPAAAAAAKPAAPAPAAAPARSPAPTPPAPPENSRTARRIGLPGFDMPASTSAAVSVTAAEPSLPLPGATTGQELAPVASEPAPVAAPEPAPQPEPEPEPAAPAVDASAARLIELDGLIAAREAEIAPLEAALEREQLAAERNLLDAESRRTDQVLARLYRAVSEVARRDGVSVVVDKSAILYGHTAVDLTERVLAHLRGPRP